MPRVSCYKGRVMLHLKYTMMLVDVDDLEMTVVNSIWPVTKSKFHLPYKLNNDFSTQKYRILSVS